VPPPQQTRQAKIPHNLSSSVKFENVKRMRRRRIAGVLTELSIVAVSTSQRWREPWEGTASAFGPISKLVEATKAKEQEKGLPPHCHPAILSGSQYAARANSMYGMNSAN